MKTLIFAILVATVPLAGASTAQAEDMGALKQEAVGKVKAFFKQLKGELQHGMKTGGPVTAISACNVQAPEIAKAQSTGGWSVGRTSFKLRNPDNRPDAWELKVLSMFEARKAKGEDPAKMTYAEIVETDGGKEFRFMKAIPTGKLCLNCHGQDIKPEVAEKLDEMYPTDQARGFKLGDIRGAFTLRKKL
jgi:hypothetical protein